MINFFQNDPDGRLAEYRFEIKMPLDAGQYAHFTECLYQNDLYPQKAFEDRTVNSIYLDTIDRQDYADNISGIGDRRKTRIRWYNDDLSSVVLERKIKSNKASRKELYPLSNPDLILPTKRSALAQLLKENKAIPTRIRAEPLYPVLQVQYAREYYLLQKDLRMTVDVGQQFKDLCYSTSSRFTKSPVHSVVEFKFPAVYREKMQRILNNIPFRIFRHSKYVIGTDATTL